MAYKKKTYRYLNAIEVEEHHTGKYGAPGQERQKKKKPTPEQMERQNQHNKEKLARRKLRKWFRVNDYLSTLTYEKQNRPPDMKTAKKHFSDFIKILRKEYRKRGYELRWMRNIEVGTKGAWHIHVVINRIPDTDIILANAWTYGVVRNILCYEKGEFRQLAAYITKTEKTDPRLKESSYSTSRNLPLPKPEEKIISRWETWKEEVRVPKGFYVDKESIREGVNPVTGYPYREYTLFRINRKEEKDADGESLHRHKYKGT